MKRKQIWEKKTTKSFEKEFVKRMNNVENMRKHIIWYSACQNRKNRKLFSTRTKLSYNNFFSKNLLWKLEKLEKLMTKPVRTFNTRIKWNIIVSILVWLYKTTIWRENKIMLYWYRLHLEKYCRRCWN